jgi:UDP-MurNAc hydroxylase
MSPQVKIQFLNHACVRIISDAVTVVSDPWFSGSIFNNGWELIWTSEQLYALAADSDFVWISHEHPDHFSPEFFRKLGEKKIDVLFQATRDRRLARYLIKQGFRVHEIQNHHRFQLSSLEQMTIGKSGLYDSWNLFVSEDTKILNLNDCIVKTDGDLRALKKRVGHVDVLLTQFSYAGWVGDPNNKTLRENAAKRRLDVVRKQLGHLEPRYVIPFASFVRFCHEENCYLNDSINRIPDFLDICADTQSAVIVMKPMDTWCVGEAHDNTPAIQFWEQAYSAIPSLELRRAQSPGDVARLRSECAAYQSRIFAKNSKAWMKVLSAVPFLKAFRPIHIRLADLGKTVRFSFFDELQEVAGIRSADIEMSSDSLSFIFANEFGFDTLMVNARCRAPKKGLDLTLKNFAIGDLNAMGWSIGFGMFRMLVYEVRLIWLVLRELKNVNPE